MKSGKEKEVSGIAYRVENRVEGRFNADRIARVHLATARFLFAASSLLFLPLLVQSIYFEFPIGKII